MDLNKFSGTALVGLRFHRLDSNEERIALVADKNISGVPDEFALEWIQNKYKLYESNEITEQDYEAWLLPKVTVTGGEIKVIPVNIKEQTKGSRPIMCAIAVAGQDPYYHYVKDVVYKRNEKREGKIRRIASLDDLLQQLAFAIVRADSFVTQYYSCNELKDIKTDYKYPGAGQDALPSLNPLPILVGKEALKVFKPVKAENFMVKKLAENGRLGKVLIAYIHPTNGKAILREIHPDYARFNIMDDAQKRTNLLALTAPYRNDASYILITGADDQKYLHVDVINKAKVAAEGAGALHLVKSNLIGLDGNGLLQVLTDGFDAMHSAVNWIGSDFEGLVVTPSEVLAIKRGNEHLRPVAQTEK